VFRANLRRSSQFARAAGCLAQLTPSAFKFIQPGTVQFRLRFGKDDNNNWIANYLQLYSGNAAAANRPQLVIEYYAP
jgi:hypothetical protein